MVHHSHQIQDFNPFAIHVASISQETGSGANLQLPRHQSDGNNDSAEVREMNLRRSQEMHHAPENSRVGRLAMDDVDHC